MLTPLPNAFYARRSQSWPTRLLVLALLVVVGLANPSDAWARRGRSASAAAAAKARREALIRTANAQLVAAKQLLSAAETKGADAQAKLAVSLTKLQAASAEAKEARAAYGDAFRERLEIERDILQSQSSSSPYIHAKQEVDNAKHACEVAEAKALDDPHVVAQLHAAKKEDYEKVKRTAVRSFPEYAAAHTRLDNAAHEIEKIRDDLYRRENDWNEVTAELVEASHALAVAESSVQSSGASRLTPKQNLRTAVEVAAVAKQAIYQSEAVLKALKATPTSTAKTPPKNTASSSKSK